MQTQASASPESGLAFGAGPACAFAESPETGTETGLWTPPRFDIWAPRPRILRARPRPLVETPYSLAPTLVQSTNGLSNTIAVSALVSGAQTIANANLVSVRSDMPITAVTDTKLNTYVQVAATNALFGNVYMAIWWCASIAAATAASNTIAAASAGSTGMDISLCEFSGGLSAFDVTVNANGSGTAIASPSFTTTHPTELLFAQVASFGTIGAATGGWGTAVAMYGFGTAIITKNVTSLTTTTATCGNTNDPWQILVATFVAPTVGGVVYDAIAFGAEC